MRLICSWSGGKDSCYALMLAIENGHNLQVILNMMNENKKVSRSHGIALEILQEHAKLLRVPLYRVPTTWANYEENYINALHHLKTELNVESVVFGDIDIQSHKDWEEKVCSTTNLKALLPLWQQNRKKLVYDMIDSGIKAIIVSCNNQLGEAFLGREITKKLVDELENIGVDACGENGEYHTLVIDCPLFSKPIKLPKHEKKTYQNYCFIIWDS